MVEFNLSKSTDKTRKEILAYKIANTVVPNSEDTNIEFTRQLAELDMSVLENVCKICHIDIN
jgi:hypothetical protein